MKEEYQLEHQERHGWRVLLLFATTRSVKVPVVEVASKHMSHVLW